MSFLAPSKTTPQAPVLTIVGFGGAGKKLISWPIP